MVEGPFLQFSHLVSHIFPLIQPHMHDTRLILTEVLTESMKMTTAVFFDELRDQ